MATPEEMAAFQAKLEGGTAPATGLGLYDRMAQSGVRLAQNPAIQAVGGLPVAAATQMAGLNGTRDTTSFQRELEGQPQHVALQPMPAGPELTLPNTPTLAQTRAPTAPGGGYGGSGMGGLQDRYKQAQMNQFGTFDQERDLVERRGELQSERIDATAHLQELNAARKQRDVEVMQQHQAQVQQKHDAFLARNQALADEIGAEKIDPAKVMGSKTSGQKVAMMIAGLLNGANGQGPQFLARIDNEISEGVRAQMANADGKKAQLSARQNLFGQMMAESGDRRVAEAQTKNLMWEAIKQKMSADAERLGIPEVSNNAQLNMNAIEQGKQNPLRVQLTGEALRAAQAQAAAAAAAQRHAEEQAWTRSMQVAEMGLKKDELAIKAGAADGKALNDDNGRFVSTGQDKDGNPTGYLARNEAAAEKQEGQRKSTEKLLGLIVEAQKIRNEQGVAGRLGTAVNPATLAGVTPKWHSQMQILRGKMTGAIKEADSLGTLDAGSQAYADSLTGGDALTGVGGKADDQLNAFRAALEAGKKTDESGSGGARATRVVDPRTGRERVVITGNPNAPRAEMPGSVKKQ